MAGLQNRNGSWRVIFWHAGKQHNLPIGEVKESEAKLAAGRVDYWLMRIKQGLVELPAGCDVVTFMRHDGKPPDPVRAASQSALTLDALRAAYLDARAEKLEQTTLDGIELHFGHLLRILSAGRLVHELKHADLQAYVNARAKEWIDPDVYRKRRLAKLAATPKRAYVRTGARPKPAAKPRPKRHPSAATIRKEMISLRTAWNWARRALGLTEPFPGSQLEYRKTVEPLPFMTWEEAEQRIDAGDEPETVWPCVYLQPGEIAELLEYVKSRPLSPCVYPILCFAAHTGARRSEIVRALPSDLNMTAGVVTIREKKRDKKRLTTRQVPLTPFLRRVLAEWVTNRSRGRTLFCKADGMAITPREAMNYFDRAVRLSKWNVLRGLHTFRHSFISALASRGVDQRIIDDIVGHQTDEQRCRYRHLYPDVKHKAIADVFG
jgi:integrase